MRRMATGLSLRVLFLCSAVSAQYYGRLISNGWGGSASHSLAGDVYAIDSTNIQIIGFTFDSSQSPACSDARFYGVNKLDDSLEELTNPDGLEAAISNYTSQDVTVPLQSKSLADYKAIGVYCSDNNPPTQLGKATFPNGFAAPAPQVIGQFTNRAHRVRSGDVTVLNNRMIKIEDFNYDGQGPDAYFYVGISASVTLASEPYGKIPDENGIDSRKATAYSDRTIILLLPEDISAVNLKWLSMYCISYTHNFGEVFFPDDLNVPPYQEVEIDRQGLNCEPMNDRYQVAWSVDGDMINFELAGLIDRETEYMSFGLSGSDDAFSMLGADVVVADFLSDSMPRAVDYYLTAYSQCAANGGACPDNSEYNNAADDVQMPTARFTNGILRISYQRKLNTTDINKDKVYMTDGTEQQVVWAIGPLNTNKETAKHYAPPRGRISANKAINFGRDPPVDNCPAFTLEPEEEKPKFVGDHIYGDEDKKVFTVEIGQAGSEQGYKAITGLPSWGIAWYVDNKLVPELHLKRGVTYTFKVRGGINPDDGSMYHPWYITDSVEGGYGQDPQGANIYKGMVDGSPVDYATGAYCEWKLSDAAIKKADEGFVYQCFQELRNDLDLDCVSGEGTDFEWTPDSTVPDTVYYQCYTHKNLGWKINLYNELPPKKDQTFAPDCTGGSVTSSTVSAVSSSPAPSVTNTPEMNGTSRQTTAADRNLITLMVSQSSADNDIVKGSGAALISFPAIIGAVIAINYL